MKPVMGKKVPEVNWPLPSCAEILGERSIKLFQFKYIMNEPVWFPKKDGA